MKTTARIGPPQEVYFPMFGSRLVVGISSPNVEGLDRTVTPIH